LICSVGGHFKQLLKLSDAWTGTEHFFVLFYKPIIDTFLRQQRVYLVCSPERNPLLFIRNFLQSLWVFARTRPDVILSTGAGMAIAMCYIGKIFGKKIVYVEDWCIIDRPSWTGRAVYWISDLFVVQREQLKRHYPKAVFGGELF
jgi:UDP-N-acetylglucosamine:LPS N-acetylglucosamine transferase